ncbi:MAG: DinB family protein [Bacteroidota bacterium]
MISAYIKQVEIHLTKTHTEILRWFRVSDELKHYRPKDGGWTILEILEHIALTSHFLLKLINKGTEKALRKSKDLNLAERLLAFDYDLGRIDAIGQHKAFAWIRPEHMEPTGTKTELAIRMQMLDQVKTCQAQLERLANGEGLQHKIMMTVNDLGKLNVYEYVYFLSKHAERHIGQMKENQLEFENSRQQ